MGSKRRFTCIVCNFVARNQQALSVHENRCQVLGNTHLSYAKEIEAKRSNQDDDLQMILTKIGDVEQADVGEISNEQAPEVSESPPVTPRLVYPSRSGRLRKQPRWFQDMVPSLHTPLPHMPAPPQTIETDHMSPLPPPDHSTPSMYETEPNEFGLYRSYTTFVTVDPERAQTVGDFCDGPPFVLDMQTTDAEINKYAPFTNHSTFSLMEWFSRSKGTLTFNVMNDLVKNVLRAPAFKLEELEGFNATREAALPFKGSDEKQEYAFLKEPGWQEGLVELKLPAEMRGEKGPESRAKSITVRGVYYRKLTEVVKSTFADSSARKFHYTPFRLYHNKDQASTPERVFTELYNSDAMLQEHEKLQQKRQEPECDRERSIAAMMLSSDSTHLANFGSASLWPIYCYFGNQSKYARSKPSSHAAHHVAYIPSLPETVGEDYMREFERAPSAHVLTHLKRELMQAIWKLLLDDEFVKAYEHGIVVRCADGVERRLYPRIMTYSADYPEKVLLSTVRYLGGCPCVRCLVMKKDINRLGTGPDMAGRQENIRQDDEERRRRVEQARKQIFTHGKHVNGPAVDKILKERSEVPTRNAFSDALSQFGFQYHQIFVPDLLHEFELGVWKAVFTHLLRLLASREKGLTNQLDERYRLTPRFGRDTIRRFRSNASAMKQLAARDFEDLLQCSIPAFEFLFPEPHNQLVLDLLFVLCCWHALAKLRQHTTSTINLLLQSTRALGRWLRKFVQTVCSEYQAHELDREVQARNRRIAKEAPLRKETNQSGRAQIRQLNLFTYKLHSLGDYPATIELFGTSDGYSTQISELEHRQVKRNYGRTNKRANFPSQIARHQHRDRLILQIKNHNDRKHSLSIPFEDSEPLPPASPNIHYQMSNEKRFYINIQEWLVENEGDVALQYFYVKLQNYLLSRMDADYVPGKTYNIASHNQLVIKNGRLYKHKYLRINFTTYDARRSQDSINPCSHADIMTLAENGESEEGDVHPYCYARVLGIFHAEVFHRKQEGQLHEGEFLPINFLWVRWYSYETDSPVGFASRRLHRLTFRHYDMSSEFGFLNPDHVLRAVHIIPAFGLGTIDRIGKTVAREPTGEEEDWMLYYVNIFADRDTFMRFVGGGIGHKSTNVERTTDFKLDEGLSGDESDVPEVDNIEESESEDGNDDGDDDEVNEEPECGPEDEEDGIDSDSAEFAGYGAYD